MGIVYWIASAFDGNIVKIEFNINKLWKNWMCSVYVIFFHIFVYPFILLNFCLIFHTFAKIHFVESTKIFSLAISVITISSWIYAWMTLRWAGSVAKNSQYHALSLFASIFPTLAWEMDFGRHLQHTWNILSISLTVECTIQLILWVFFEQGSGIIFNLSRFNK